ncbi:dynamin family protein [Megasphaera elsdenii]|uniref:dynamin family protein n=1 Tax=Megasphaera elsdenii TaxID=907 RepID=UPI0039F6330D
MNCGYLWKLVMILSEDEKLIIADAVASDENDYDFFGDTAESAVGNEEEEAGNIYLENHEQAIQLAASLLPCRSHYTKRQEVLADLDYLIDVRMVEAMQHLTSINVLAESSRLKKLSDKLLAAKQIRALNNKLVVGLGGRFSAGKSSFINSRLKSDAETILLPENQNPTTSIPTYVVSGPQNGIRAYLQDGWIVRLKLAAMQAMTHDFYETYRIGFSRFVRSLMVYTNAFPEEISRYIALLDTPGYNKADAETRDSISDAKITAKQLKSVDYLIWLVHIDNGTVGAADLEFLRQIHPEQPILVVFNHADEKTDEEKQQVVSAGKQALEQAAIPYFDIVAYSSRYGEEYLGTDSIREFFRTVSKVAEHRQPVPQELAELQKRMNRIYTAEKKAACQQLANLQETIHQAEDILSILSLLRIYRRESNRVRNLNQDYDDFSQIMERLKRGIQNLSRH